jgi:RNA-directed DNA polymerase
MDGAEWTSSDIGSPQGAVVSPTLANIYLHYTFDLWADRWRRHHARGNVEFGRFAAECRARRGHICGHSRAGYFLLKRKTRRDRMRGRLRAIKEELRRRMHEPLPEQGRWLGQVVRGYFAYDAVPTNAKSLCAFRHVALPGPR